MSQDILEHTPVDRLDRNGRKLFVTITIMNVFNLTTMLIAAGDIAWPRAWAMVCFFGTLQLLGLSILARKNPELVNERGKGIKKDTKSFDRWFFKLYFPMGFVMLVVAALDGGRYGWSTVPMGATIAGFVVGFVMYVFGFWAILTNTHFEMTVRLQTDRNQKVISTGPYAFIRHPGYVTAVTVMMMCPLMLGSWWAYIPGTLASLIMITRTALEDRMLHNELEGYKEYAQRVRYRLFPGVW